MSTYVPIQTIRITSDTSTITFTGIPQTYTDLVIVGNIASTGDDLVPTVRVGSGTIDSGSNYSQTTGGFIAGAGIASFRDSNDTRMRFGRGGFSTTQPIGVFTLHFQNYSNTTTNKTVLARNSAFDRTVSMCVGTWRSTSAINIIQFTEYSGGTYVSGSTFTLYGIGTGAPKAMGGTTITTDGTYWYHAFQSSGLFEPLQNITADVLVIAGGGGGGRNKAGGGGAGKIVYATSQTLSGPYTVTVGAGGNKEVSGTLATNGGNSVFGSLITADGGGRGGNEGSAGATGGSGGGGGRFGAAGSITSYSGVGTAYGNSGAAGQGDNPPYRGGGGGGAGSAGTSGNGGGHGGAGLSTWSSWATATRTGVGGFYAGGGGGGAYGGSAGNAGSGGAGAGTNHSGTNDNGGIGGNATVNTGSGGGGGGNVSDGGNGGSGIVIVRYLV